MRRTETDLVDVASLVRPSTVLRAVSRYDLVLGVIPLTWLAAAVGASVTRLPVHLLVAAAGLVCSLVLVDALYVHPPTETRPNHQQERRSPRDEIGDRSRR
ncbi:hypothetical protein [Haloarchaeobius salinus]|uniref:hypothetical protein n=1 Tax=Haloarchaeobius salinus TaxID=1198298 RepID=UPI002109F108|nr:hypothetical protein [Haloarchaeobius salinus]